ncbi:MULTISPECIES: glycosyltransferase family 2 protein [Actinomyces]|uniref:Glycosyltransferase family 2 protein n=1 Tax=Actinomyces respiraculi TaxID=2744574 RepID=A0A7T0PX36_9ACTO|nr:MULTISPECIES: glycosyltransferase family 2 protein [Actinomyces]QPL06068.1 glycosyltransferase family 2 protein [Actinomyces respiraculi]
MNDLSLSVVVPAYNVEEYLEQCVKSVLQSKYPLKEVIIVDDGSTDGTGKLADELKVRSRILRVVHQSNAGLGAARNRGLELASGDYVAFVDSDDEVPPGAYSALMHSVLMTGSPYAVGAVERFDSQKVWQPWFVSEVHATARPRCDAFQFPPIVWNVFAWSKVFRREDFVKEIGGFPEGVLYEDQEVSLQMYLRTNSTDVVPDIVYRWRQREDGSSITQNKNSVSDLRERLAVAVRSSDIVRSAGSVTLSEYWYRKWLGEDLWWYFRVVPLADRQFWDALREAVRFFVARAPVASVEGLVIKRRDLIHLCLAGDYNGFVARLNQG